MLSQKDVGRNRHKLPESKNTASQLEIQLPEASRSPDC